MKDGSASVFIQTSARMMNDATGTARTTRMTGVNKSRASPKYRVRNASSTPMMVPAANPRATRPSESAVESQNFDVPASSSHLSATLRGDGTSSSAPTMSEITSQTASQKSARKTPRSKLRFGSCGVLDSCR